MSRLASRRRFMAISGAAAGLSLLPGGVPAPTAPVRWRGRALGAEASIVIYHDDTASGRAILADCAAEIVRLEGLFSLFRRDSALVGLNRDGRLASPPLELVALLRRAGEISRASDGAFDVTVQPLWSLYARHFSRIGADPGGPPAKAMRTARSLVDWRDLTVAEDEISLARSGMAVTLNGIAQGYITDRITALLREHGIGNILVNLGEFRAAGGHADGRSWRVGVADPLRAGELIENVELSDLAVASSGGYGTVFDAAGRFHHLFDPMTGGPAPYWAGVTVVAGSATTADALSTTLAVVAPGRAGDLLRRLGGQAAILVARDGTVTRLEA